MKGCEPIGIGWWHQQTAVLGLASQLVFLFLCFSNFIIVCHAQLDVKPSYLMKLFQCKYISMASFTKRTMCLAALLNLYVL